MTYLSYRRNLSKLRRQENKLRKAYFKAVEEAERRGGPQEAARIGTLERTDLDLVEDEIANLVSAYLISKARFMYVAIPPWAERSTSGLWEKSDIDQRWRLSHNGLAQVSQAIRTVRRDRLQMVTTLISFLIGLIGAATGLLAAIGYIGRG